MEITLVRRGVRPATRAVCARGKTSNANLGNFNLGMSTSGGARRGVRGLATGFPIMSVVQLLIIVITTFENVLN